VRPSPKNRNGFESPILFATSTSRLSYHARSLIFVCPLEDQHVDLSGPGLTSMGIRHEEIFPFPSGLTLP
jgi:hypothetical protein